MTARQPPPVHQPPDHQPHAEQQGRQGERGKHGETAPPLAVSHERRFFRCAGDRVAIQHLPNPPDRGVLTMSRKHLGDVGCLESGGGHDGRRESLRVGQRL